MGATSFSSSQCIRGFCCSRSEDLIASHEQKLAQRDYSCDIELANRSRAKKAQAKKISAEKPAAKKVRRYRQKASGNKKTPSRRRVANRRGDPVDTAKPLAKKAKPPSAQRA